MKKKNFLKIALVFFLTLNFNTAFTQSVVINEVVTDPQTDWSTNDFDGTDGGGTISGGVDEYIELFIKISGLDLTNWTLELLDGTDVTGDLTNTATGAFDVSNYITSGSGTFTNTEVGDYLVLGNVFGAGAMNNSITINLKNSGGTIIDTVTLGGADGEAPSGNAASPANEAVIRSLNGNYTNNNSSDFTQGVSSIGSSNSNTKNWLGKTDNDWTNNTNWEGNSVPIGTADVFITNGLSNYPTSSTAVTVNTVIVASGASLIAEDVFTGNITYQRSLATTNWYLVSSPVSGESREDIIAGNDLAEGTSSNIGLAPYDNTQADVNQRWDYQTTASVGVFPNGQGFSIKLKASNNISFTGTINTENITRGISLSSSAFNLVGNPFTSYINSGTLLTDNTADLANESIYVWNQGTNNYDTYVTVNSFNLAPTQGFFVEANGTAFPRVIFNEAIQNHQTTPTFQKSARPEVHLFLSDGKNKKYAKVYYIDGTTTGFDNGYDGKLFGGVPQPFALYTHLVSDSEGKNFQLQSLPNTNHESMVIPVGINADARKEITFSAEALNLPADINVYLEDRLTNTFIRLDEANSSYKTTSDVALDGIGRFYVHTKTSSVLSVDTANMDNISIYKTTNSNLRLVGISQGKASIKLYSILGKQVFEDSFTSNGVQNITIPALSSGIYIVQLETETGSLNKKITLE